MTIRRIPDEADSMEKVCTTKFLTEELEETDMMDNDKEEKHWAGEEAC